MDARFPDNFVFWALSIAYNWLQKVTNFYANMRPHEIWPYMEVGTLPKKLEILKYHKIAT